MRKILLALLIIGLLVLPCEAKTPWTSKPPLGNTIDYSHPLAKGLAAVFLMNEGGGLKVTNLVSSLTNGTLNSIVWKPTGIFGNGTSSYVSLGTTSKFKTQIFSVVSSFKLVDNTRGSDPVAEADYQSWVCRCSAGKLAILDSHEAAVLTGNTTLSNGIFYTGAFINNASNLASVYLNGKFDGSASHARSFTSGGVNRPLIAASGGLSVIDEWFSGTIQYVYIYTRALSPSEIRQLYREPYCFIKSPEPWYKVAITNYTTTLRGIVMRGLSIR